MLHNSVDQAVISDDIYRLGVMYEIGQDRPTNYSKALECYLDAAILNHAGAMNKLGNMHRLGLGTMPNPARAYELYQLASQRGNEAATENLELMRETFASAKMLQILKNITGNQTYWRSHKKPFGIKRMAAILADEHLSPLEQAVQIWYIANNRYEAGKTEFSFNDLLYKAIKEEDVGQLIEIEKQVLAADLIRLELLRDIVSDVDYWEDKGNIKGINKINKILVQHQLSNHDKLQAISDVAQDIYENKSVVKFYRSPLDLNTLILYQAIINKDNEKLSELEQVITKERGSRNVKVNSSYENATFEQNSFRFDL